MGQEVDRVYKKNMVGVVGIVNLSYGIVPYSFIFLFFRLRHSIKMRRGWIVLSLECVLMCIKLENYSPSSSWFPIISLFAILFNFWDTLCLGTGAGGGETDDWEGDKGGGGTVAGTFYSLGNAGVWSKGGTSAGVGALARLGGRIGAITNYITNYLDFKRMNIWPTI